jgi:hypothetical protein
MTFDEIVSKKQLVPHVSGLVARRDIDAAVNIIAQVCDPQSIPTTLVSA